MKAAFVLTTVLCMTGSSFRWAQAQAQAQPVGGKPATAATKAANAAVLNELPFQDRADFEEAQRGLVAKPDTLTIRNAKGDVVWDLEAYKQYIGIDKPAPDTVNPSLWRNAQLTMQHGLFKVSDRIYQVRGFDPRRNTSSTWAARPLSCAARERICWSSRGSGPAMPRRANARQTPMPATKRALPPTMSS